MDVAGGILAVLAAVLLLHRTVLPLIHGRAALWFGRQAFATTLSLIAAIATQWWPAVFLLVAAIVVAVVWGPWIAWGVSADAVAGAAKRSAEMVRARFEPAGVSPGAEPGGVEPGGVEPGDAGAFRALVGGAATVRVFGLVSGVTVVVLTGRRTPKVKLWRNLFRKQILNHSWRVG
jgi:hypothetical protein